MYLPTVADIVGETAAALERRPLTDDPRSCGFQMTELAFSCYCAAWALVHGFEYDNASYHRANLSLAVASGIVFG